MTEYASIPAEKWGHCTTIDRSASELLVELKSQVEESVHRWKCLGMDSDPANDHQEYARIYSKIPVEREFFDAFFNGRSGYRAQYAVSIEKGEQFNKEAVGIIVSVLLLVERYCDKKYDRKFYESSLRGVHSKLWFTKDVSDLSSEKRLLQFEESIRWPAWKRYWESKSKPRKGLLAPVSEEPAILLNGTFLCKETYRVWDQKPRRSQELHEIGWV